MSEAELRTDLADGLLKNINQLQALVGHADALNEYIQHTGSGVFVCPPGLREHEDWGRQLLSG